MSEIEQFLNQFLEGYLFEDIKSVIKHIPNNLHPGAAGYPIIMSVCSGIEMLGTFVQGKEEEPFGYDKHLNYFGHYWVHYLSKINPEYRQYVSLARELVRNGLAHTYATKMFVGVTRRDQSLHLKAYNGVIVIHADSFYQDFQRSYFEVVKPLLLPTGQLHQLASKRLAEMKALHASEAADIFKNIHKKAAPSSIAFTPSMQQILSENNFTTLSGTEDGKLSG
jgi:hypothetical protein